MTVVGLRKNLRNLLVLFFCMIAGTSYAKEAEPLTIQEVHRRPNRALMSKKIDILDQRQGKDYERYSLVFHWNLKKISSIGPYRLEFSLLWPDKTIQKEQMNLKGKIGRNSYSLYLKEVGKESPPIAYEGRVYDKENRLVGSYRHPLWFTPLTDELWNNEETPQAEEEWTEQEETKKGN